jgi:methionyl-tRNA formyltransferase
VAENELDVLVNVGTPRILKTHLLDATRIGVLNVHPGLLPKYRGCSAVEWALYLGDDIGNTAHVMSDRIDAGPILESKVCIFDGTESYVAVRTRVYTEGIVLGISVLSRINRTGWLAVPREQQDEGKAIYRSPIPSPVETQLYVNPWFFTRPKNETRGKLIGQE